MSLQTAELINSYHMHEVLGSGAYGVVHKATKHGIEYAVKCMSKKRLKKKGFGLSLNRIFAIKS